MKGKLLALVLAICLVLTACHGSVPPPPESSDAPGAVTSRPGPESEAVPASIPASRPPEAPGSESSEDPAPPAQFQPAPETPDVGSAPPPTPQSGGSEAPSDPEGKEKSPEPPEPSSAGTPEDLPTPPDHPAPPDTPDDPTEDPASQPAEPEQSVLPGGCQWRNLTEAALLTLINKERVRQGQVPLTYDSDLAQAARLRAEELYKGNYVAHTRPDGSPWETVLQTDIPTEYAYAGENLAWSNHAPGEDLGAFRWFSLWKESKSHLAAMVGERYTHCGVAVLTGPYYEGEDQSYAVAVFCSY